MTDILQGYVLDALTADKVWLQVPNVLVESIR